jgi:hypothetical protein
MKFLITDIDQKDINVKNAYTSQFKLSEHLPDYHKELVRLQEAISVGKPNPKDLQAIVDVQQAILVNLGVYGTDEGDSRILYAFVSEKQGGDSKTATAGPEQAISSSPA